MKIANAVIGSAFGDCGKGKAVDFLCSLENTKKTIVVRFNSGAQAGHTVVDPNGNRSIFHHIGSGTLQYVDTYLSEFFVVNPILFLKEIVNYPYWKFKVFVNSKCLVTTHYDILYNQILEDCRGNKKHGSCGIGFGATIERNLRRPDLSITVKDISDFVSFQQKIFDIQKYYIEKAEENNLMRHANSLYFYKKEFIIQFFDDCRNFINGVTVVDFDIFNNYDHVIFEGAQGLLLDEDNLEYFPHTTWSKTGLCNIKKLTENSSIDAVNVFYTTRPYMTRHGAGPFHTQTNESFEDKTNIPNQFQGTLRFGKLNLDYLQQTIQIDFDKYAGKKDSLNIFLNHLDHFPKFYMKDYCDISYNYYDFCNDLIGIVDPAQMFISIGETRNHVTRGH